MRFHAKSWHTGKRLRCARRAPYPAYDILHADMASSFCCYAFWLDLLYLPGAWRVSCKIEIGSGQKCRCVCRQNHNKRPRTQTIWLCCKPVFLHAPEMASSFLLRAYCLGCAHRNLSWRVSCVPEIRKGTNALCVDKQGHHKRTCERHVMTDIV